MLALLPHSCSQGRRRLALPSPPRPPVANVESWAVGSRWTYRNAKPGSEQTHSFTTRREAVYDDRAVLMMSVEPSWSGSRKITCVGADTWVVDITNHSFVACLKDGEELVSSRPHNGHFNWPLFVGKTWTANYDWTNREVEPRVSTPASDVYEVLAYEEVTVPAGRFKAFKIQTSSSRYWGKTMWYAPGVGTVKVTSWRSPDNAYGGAKFSEELVAYSLGK